MTEIHTFQMQLLKWLVQAPRYIFIGLVRGYQYVISPHLPRSCRFTPSCSTYAAEAYQHFGVLRGTLLTVWRLLRCHPLGGQGYDPPSWWGMLPSHYEVSENDDDPPTETSTREIAYQPSSPTQTD